MPEKKFNKSESNINDNIYISRLSRGEKIKV